MTFLLHAEGQENDLVVLGEKGRAQLSRDRAKYIRETIADTQKVRITFSQVCYSQAKVACCHMQTPTNILCLTHNHTSGSSQLAAAFSWSPL